MMDEDTPALFELRQAVPLPPTVSVKLKNLTWEAHTPRGTVMTLAKASRRKVKNSHSGKKPRHELAVPLESGQTLPMSVPYLTVGLALLPVLMKWDVELLQDQSLLVCAWLTPQLNYRPWVLPTPKNSHTKPAHYLSL